jgi:hypothetical protein
MATSRRYSRSKAIDAARKAAAKPAAASQRNRASRFSAFATLSAASTA